MRPVEQRLFFNAETGERGDCLKCCMASLLELEYDDVPHFASMGERWWIEWTNWLASRGWRIGNAWYSLDESDPTRLIGWTQGYWLAGVKSLRTRPDGEHIQHMILMHDGDVAWDPHPARASGHLGFISGELLVPVNPARFVYLPAGGSGTATSDAAQEAGSRRLPESNRWQVPEQTGQPCGSGTDGLDQPPLVTPEERA